MGNRVVGHYRIIEKIGAGAMGEVFRARDDRLGRDVAIKIIKASSSENPDHLRRFELEARAAAALNHPNILAIYDVGTDGATPYIVSELLEGQTLRQRLAPGPLSSREAIDFALQIAHGLTAAHERHITHRDLKPENLFITNDELVKILDFGVAKLQPRPGEKRSIENLTTITKHGSVVGTVAYMSPEQLRGRSVDHRSDIFSFGAILFEMLAGARAFRGETEVDTMTAVLREEPAAQALDDARIPPAYQDIIKHCLEKEPEDRFQSARDLRFALQTVSEPGKETASWRPASRFSKWFPWLASALLAVATTILIIAIANRPPASQPTYTRLTFEAGTVYSGRFAPDKSIIYSAAWNGKPTQVFSTVANSLVSQPLQITDATLLGVSRTHELALVLRGVHSGQLETVNGMLARGPVAGGSPREVLSDVRWADWDPKGELAVVHYVEGESRLEYPIGKVIYQSTGWISDIRFSPRGDAIAFMNHPALWDTRGTVRLLNLADPDHIRTLSREWDSESGLAWRPDGKEIWFTAVEKGTNHALMAVDVSGQLRTLLALPVAMTLEDVDTDGRVLVSLNSRRLNMGYTDFSRKEDLDISWHDWSSPRDISPDGRSILFEDSSEAAGRGYAVAIRQTGGEPPTTLGEGSAGGLSPDGKWAISVSTTHASQITLLPVGEGQSRTINVSSLEHINNGWARFFPDGQRVAIIGNEAGHPRRCYAVNISNGAAKAVTPDDFLCGPLSPDGRSLVGSKPNQSLTIYSIDGGSPRPIPNLKSDFIAVQWSSDGSSLYGYHWGEFPSEVYKVEIATGKETPVHELTPSAPAGVVLVAPVVVSPDGKRFAYSYNQTLSSLQLITGVH
ncbi:MAG: protein kinase domain-containing protein [Candidatus Sulfotelmatobacter sp.]